MQLKSSASAFKKMSFFKEVLLFTRKSKENEIFTEKQNKVTDFEIIFKKFVIQRTSTKVRNQNFPSCAAVSGNSVDTRFQSCK